MSNGSTRKKSYVEPECPLRPGEPCTLCQAFATGPHDCQTVKLVMEDPELRQMLAEHRRAYKEQRKHGG